MQDDLKFKFIEACQKAEAAFEKWASGLEEADLKTHFRELAEVRDHLRNAIDKAKEVALKLSN